MRGTTAGSCCGRGGSGGGNDLALVIDKGTCRLGIVAAYKAGSRGGDVAPIRGICVRIGAILVKHSSKTPLGLLAIIVGHLQ